MAGNMNTLGIIVFSIAFGIMLSRMGERGRPLLHIFELIQDVVIRIVMVIIWYAGSSSSDLMMLNEMETLSALPLNEQSSR